MAYPPGFNYVYGPSRMQYFPVSSTATFVARNPVSFGDSGVIEQYADGLDNVVGVANSDSSQSLDIAGTKVVPVLVPQEDTVFAAGVQTGVASSSLTVYNAFNLEVATEHLRVDVDSTDTKVVQLVPNQAGVCDANSADSTVFVSFVQSMLQPFGSISTVILP